MAVKGKVLNIEIGDQIIKICQSAPHGRSIQIARSLLLQTPAGLVSDGVISDPEKLAKFLKEQLAAAGLGGMKNAVFTLTSGKVATREVMLPPVKDKNLKSIVQTNASDYFPVDLSSYHIAYQLLERVTTGDQPGCRVLVLAVPLSLLQGYFTLAEQAGLAVQAVDYSGNSQYQALRQINGEGACLYVNVDCGHSLITILRGDTYLMQRSFSFGGDDLIQNYLAANNLGAEHYIDALNACSVPEADLVKNGNLSAETIHESLSRVASSVTRGIEYFNSNHWGTQVENIVLMGACGHMAGLREMVNSATGLHTEYLDDTPAVASLSNEAQSISRFISCTGSSLEPMDLIPPSYREKKKKAAPSESEQSILPGILVLVLAVAAGAALCMFGFLRYNTAQAEQKKMEADISSLAYTKDVYNTYVTFKKGEQALVDFGTSIDSPNDSLTSFISELEKKMPSDILLLSATCSKETILMNVTVPDFDKAAVVIKQLRSFDSIRNIVASSMAEATDETGATTVSFSVTCTYGANPWLNGTDPYGAAAAKAASSAAASSAAASSSSI